MVIGQRFAIPGTPEKDLRSFADSVAELIGKDTHSEDIKAGSSLSLQMVGKNWSGWMKILPPGQAGAECKQDRCCTWENVEGIDDKVSWISKSCQKSFKAALPFSWIEIKEPIVQDEREKPETKNNVEQKQVITGTTVDKQPVRETTSNTDKQKPVFSKSFDFSNSLYLAIMVINCILLLLFFLLFPLLIRHAEKSAPPTRKQILRLFCIFFRSVLLAPR